MPTEAFSERTEAPGVTLVFPARGAARAAATVRADSTPISTDGIVEAVEAALAAFEAEVA